MKQPRSMVVVVGIEVSIDCAGLRRRYGRTDVRFSLHSPLPDG